MERLKLEEGKAVVRGRNEKQNPAKKRAVREEDVLLKLFSNNLILKMEKTKNIEERKEFQQKLMR